MFSGSVQMVKGRIRPVTCKISNKSSCSEGGNSAKPQTSAGSPATGDLHKCKTPSERKSGKVRIPQTDSSKDRAQTGASPRKNFAREPGGVSSDAAKVLWEEGYVIGKSIGGGSYCKVRVAYKSHDNGADKKIACKMIDKRKASNDFVVKFLPRELGIIKRISHPNIVSVFDVFEMDNLVFIFMEICEHGDLLDYIRNKGALPENRAREFFRQIVGAVEYLHSLDIAHRDLKCENVLLAKRDLVKITDFGFARWCKNDAGQRILSETFCGSAAYAAPEILQCTVLCKVTEIGVGGRKWSFNRPSLYACNVRRHNADALLAGYRNCRIWGKGHAYNPKMYDVWSLGCVLYVMLTATMPFDDSNVAQMLEIQLTKSLTFPPKSQLFVSPLAKKLVMHLLAPDITRRATLTQVTRSFWLQGSSAIPSKTGAIPNGKR